MSLEIILLLYCFSKIIILVLFIDLIDLCCVRLLSTLIVSGMDSILWGGLQIQVKVVLLFYMYM